MKVILLGASLIPWVLGCFAVYVTSAQFSGLGIVESYRAFEVGSNIGNALWFVSWTGVSAAVCWLLARKNDAGAVRSASFVLYCYGTPAALLILPDAAMSFAVSHVRAFTDDTALHSPVVEFLVVSGVGALVCAVALSVWGGIRKRHGAAQASGL
ncbi:hypothetical protein ACIPWF_08425 [Paenarthrobacter sp. NPDC089989]|uniref:hypothetical protein n=1 Tax=unclassified Paenarthrobacter TaxID=2634190 RepID=UPI00382B5DDF